MAPTQRPTIAVGDRTGRPIGQFPAGRYGWRRDPARHRRRRWLVWLAGALVIVGGLTISVKLYRQYASPPYEVLNLASAEINDTGVTVDFDVRVPPGAGATCTVVGHTFEGRTVGSAQVDVPPGGGDVTMLHVTYRLTTTERPMTGEVPGCGPRNA
jgi:Domain of unknown function (DUF4307)